MANFCRDKFAILVALAVFGLLLWKHAPIVGWIQADRIDLGNLYNAVFGWSSIQTGFLFAVYGFVTGKQDGFIEAVRYTKAMAFFNQSLWRAISVGFLLTFTSMPLLVAPVNPTAFDIWYWLIALWFALFVWSFLLFCRAAYTFGIISRVPDNTDRPAH